MLLADTPDEGWVAVKAYSMLDEVTYLALAEAAEDAGLPIVGHIPERVALGTAIDAGQDGMEHFGRVVMVYSTSEESMLNDLRSAMAEGPDLVHVFEIMASRNRIVLETWDESLCNSILARMADAGMHVSPTLVMADFYTGNWPAPDRPRMRMIPAEVHALAEDSIALDRQTFLTAHTVGVPILASTDVSFANPYLFHGFSLLDDGPERRPRKPGATVPSRRPRHDRVFHGTGLSDGA